jgi:hypothetical protein
MASKPETIGLTTGKMVSAIKKIVWFAKTMVSGIETMVCVKNTMVSTSETIVPAAKKTVSVAPTMVFKVLSIEQKLENEWDVRNCHPSVLPMPDIVILRNP